MKDKYQERKEILDKRLETIFPMRIIYGKKCFMAPNGFYFDVDIIRGNHSLVVEYAYGGHFGFEDGDCFDIDLSENEMFDGMLHEILEPECVDNYAQAPICKNCLHNNMDMERFYCNILGDIPLSIGLAKKMHCDAFKASKEQNDDFGLEKE